jgi:hypothetical protein
MAVYRFSALFDGQSVSFNPAADVLTSWCSITSISPRGRGRRTFLRRRGCGVGARHGRSADLQHLNRKLVLRPRRQRGDRSADRRDVPGQSGRRGFGYHGDLKPRRLSAIREVLLLLIASRHSSNKMLSTPTPTIRAIARISSILERLSPLSEEEHSHY